MAGRQGKVDAEARIWDNRTIVATDTSITDRVVATHMMIRVALTGISLAMVPSVLLQIHSDGCALTSISAPLVHRCPRHLRRRPDGHQHLPGRLQRRGLDRDLLLNLAGLLAPIVAIAPTTIGKHLDKDCLVAPGSGRIHSLFARSERGSHVRSAVATASYLTAGKLSQVLA